MASLDTSKVQEDIYQILIMEPDSVDVEYDDLCTGSGQHRTRCVGMMKHRSTPCIPKKIPAARRRQMRLAKLELRTKFAQNTSEANGLCVNEGMAMDSCIYEIG